MHEVPIACNYETLSLYITIVPSYDVSKRTCAAGLAC